MATALRIPKLIIRSLSQMNHDMDVKPHISIENYTIPLGNHNATATTAATATATNPEFIVKLNKRDRLYFHLQALLKSKGVNYMYILELIYSLLDTKKLISKDIKNHFHPLNTLSVKWWNYTHIYIYKYSDVADVVKYITELEAFPLNKRDLYDIV